MFSLPANGTLLDLPIQFSPFLFLLSILIVVLGAYTAFSCYSRIDRNALISKDIWIGLASISLGVGIWSMHFSGMLAYHSPVHMSYDLFFTILSIIPAIIAPVIAFTLINIPRKGKKLYIYSGVIMALGIIGMHFLGIYAMEFIDVDFYFSPWLFVFSLIVCVLGSIVSVAIFSRLQKSELELRNRIVAAVVFGLVVASMHYSNMLSMKYYTTAEAAQMHGMVDKMDAVMLGVGFTVGIFIILLLLLLITFFDHYIEKRVKYFDPLTRLPNRVTFQNDLEKKTKAHAVAIWHFHQLESYNTEHGYLFVDRLIQYISKMLIDHTPALTKVYRTEGNRFTFIAKDWAASEELYEELQILSNHLKGGIIFEGKEIVIQGVCACVRVEKEEFINRLYMNTLQVLRHPSIAYDLDIVNYNAKLHTRNFTDEIIDGMHQAMVNNDLFLVYQPKVAANSNEVHSVEALIRWQHPRHGFLSPAIFIPILEANDKLIDLTDWIVERVCVQLDEWRRNYIPIKQVAINIPGPYLTSSRLMDVLKAMTIAYNIPPHSIELEITETSFVKTIDSAEKAVHKYREEGFSVALDDFGTGVSSLYYLKQIPITTLKIDKSFVDGVPHSKKDAAIIESIVQLGNSLNMQVVVEGVETIEQVDYLIDQCGGPMMQGFYFAKPMKPCELENWLTASDLTVKNK